MLLAGCVVLAAGCRDKEGEPREGQTPSIQAAPPTERDRDARFATHHDRCVEMFVKAPGFGFERMRWPEHAASGHSVEGFPLALSQTDESNPGLDWRMHSLQLVSLLSQKRPGVYAAVTGMMTPNERPRLRDLDEFESAALVELKMGERVSFSATTSDMPRALHDHMKRWKHDKPARRFVRMLGAIRARPDCVKCHGEKKEGDLLGAFSYVFERP